MMKPIILTTMIYIAKDDSFLVQLRKKRDWPGLTFVGGHVENNESIEECAIREVYEETNLVVKNLEKVGYIEWNIDNARHLAILFRTRTYSGNIKGSTEGDVFFIKENEINNYPLSDDFEKIYNMMKY